MKESALAEKFEDLSVARATAVEEVLELIALELFEFKEACCIFSMEAFDTDEIDAFWDNVNELARSKSSALFSGGGGGNC